MLNYLALSEVEMHQMFWEILNKRTPYANVAGFNAYWHLV